MCWRSSRPFVWPLFLFLISDHDASGSDPTYRTEQAALAVYKYTFVIKTITFLYKICYAFRQDLIIVRLIKYVKWGWLCNCNYCFTDRHLFIRSYYNSVTVHPLSRCHSPVKHKTLINHSTQRNAFYQSPAAVKQQVDRYKFIYFWFCFIN